MRVAYVLLPAISVKFDAGCASATCAIDEVAELVIVWLFGVLLFATTTTAPVCATGATDKEAKEPINDETNKTSDERNICIQNKNPRFSCGVFLGFLYVGKET
jgi:hypothetical protein